MSKPRGKSTKGKGKVHKDDEQEREVLAYKVLSAEQCTELMALPVLEMQNKLRETFKLDNHETDLKEASALDHYTSAIWWGTQQGFTTQQLSGFFTVMHTLLDNVKEKHMSLVENLTEFKKTLIGIGVDDIRPGGLDFFDTSQAKLISDYVYTSFFQHYQLYLYMFTCTQAEEIIGTDLEVEVAKPADLPFPPPLDEGVTEEMHQLYIATPPPTPSPELPELPSVEGSEIMSPGTTPKLPSPSMEKAAPNVPEEVPPDAAEALEDSVAQSDLFAQLTAQDVKEVVESVAQEMLGSLQNEVAAKLRDKENLIIQRINKVHNIAEV